MRKKALLIVINLIMLAISTYSQHTFNPLSVDITLKPDSVTKVALLDSITKETNIHFSYNPLLLDAETKIKPDSGRFTLLDILSKITDPNLLGIQSLDNQVILYPISPEKEPDELSGNTFFTVRGIIMDQKKEEAIPFCNIAIVNQALGTMSNKDGRFAIKIPEKHLTDTLRFSSLGFSSYDLPLVDAAGKEFEILLNRKIYQLKSIDVVHYNPAVVLQKFFNNFSKNYERNYILLTTFYREIIQENSNYTDVSEAVLHMLKAPYNSINRDDLVRFIKGRKSSEVQPFDEIRFRLKGGPYYITRLDVVKNNESFINPDFIQLYEYRFQQKTLLDGRETAVITFKPVYNLRELLYEGTLFFDIETWALSRAEFNYTRQGLKEARNLMIEKEPRDYRAVPSQLSYTVQYKLFEGKWHFFTAQSAMQINLLNREKKQKTKFFSISEILTTNIEKGDFQFFGRKDIFRSNEFFTEKITNYDSDFWKNYNVIQPEDELEKALRNLDKQEVTTTK
jgi:hypothetical protein